MLIVKTEIQGDVPIVRLLGKITIGKGDIVLRDAISAVLKTSARKLLIDLREASWVDAAGLGQLIASYKDACAGNVTMILLTESSSRVAEFFRATKLDLFFTIFNDESAAVASFPT